MPRLACAAALFVAAVAAAQPSPVAPTYSAFPGMKTPMQPFDLGNGKTGQRPDYPALYHHLRAAADRPLAPDAPPAARVRSHQLKAGVEYLLGTHRSRNRIARCFAPDELVELTGMVNDVYRAAAAGAADPAALVEERVRVLKELEREVQQKVDFGTDPPQNLDFVRVHRLAAEGELLALTARK